MLFFWCLLVEKREREGGEKSGSGVGKKRLEEVGHRF